MEQRWNKHGTNREKRQNFKKFVPEQRFAMEQKIGGLFHPLFHSVFLDMYGVNLIHYYKWNKWNKKYNTFLSA